MSSPEQDEILDALRDISTSMKKLESQGSVTSSQVEIVRQSLERLRVDYAARFRTVDTDIANVNQRVSNVVHETRGVAKQGSDNDLKLESEQARLIIKLDAVERAQKAATSVALQALSATRAIGSKTDVLVTETRAQTPMIKNRSAKGAAYAALAVAALDIVREIVHRLPSGFVSWLF
jgi:hypothetical protein